MGASIEGGGFMITSLVSFLMDPKLLYIKCYGNINVSPLMDNIWTLTYK